ncbi:TetR/AcrR family transcriptional regulator [Treponema sp.]|uniref:TetR/AcrR family transcriptional regulator n=1 Tax=Treponema sp. TaxID=166 RepID=UPI00298DCB88|nr:TetR/AcrR family transcriptional regulator [Treponema sp.]MCR5612359.1 TetR/AcrR family transcriptional regulator [Treponema sp.]
MAESENKTLQKILSVAQNEFLDKGFRGASLRTIVKQAGVTTGAFYGYFKSKEELFDALVKEHAEYILGIYDNILKEFEKMPLEQQLTSMDNYSDLGLQKMFEYIWEHKMPFHLISKSAAGTKYENFLEQLSQKDIDSTEDFYNLLESQGKPVERIDPLIEQIVITGTFSSFFNLILRDIPKEEAKRGLSQMFRFYRGGWNSLMHFAE